MRKSKVDEIVDKPANLSFLNVDARAWWILNMGAQRDLVLVYTVDFEGEVFTQEAFAILRAYAPAGLLSSAFIDASTAARITNTVWTAEDIETFVAARRLEGPSNA